jgi:hypothetical protein
MLKVKFKWVAGIIAISTLLIGSSAPFFVSPGPVAAKTENPYLVRTFVDEDGRQIDVITVPGRPPEVKAAVATVPEADAQTETGALSEVPAFDWSYGCSATSAAMLFGYYDRTGYRNMYTGPSDGGVCPLDNSIWGPGIGGSPAECPLSATHNGIDGRTTRGHVDDYWIEYGSTLQDPWIVNGWVEHTHGDCTGDFMGTNQSEFDNPDGSTTFGYYTDGSPWVDPDLSFLGLRDGCHGMKLFAESRGYSVVTNFNQLIYGYQGNTLGFTFDDYMAEIDAGRPVLIHVEGHTMLGFGYDVSGETVYLHDTWDYSTHTMTWGGTYAGYQHYMVSVIQLAQEAPSVTTNDASGITDNSATLNGNLDDLGTTSSVDVSFEWGETTAYGDETTPESMVTTGPFSFSLPGLSPDTTYHFTAKAVGDGTNYGDDMSFTTKPPPGLLRVETSPAVATTIYVDGIPRNDWGLDWVKMTPGEYTLSVSDVTGYLTPTEIEVTYYPPEGDPVTQTQPLSQPVEVYSDGTTQVVVSFTQLGNLRVETSPVLPTANTIFVDGNPMNDWGLWVNLEAGDYTVSFQDMDGYQTPPPTAVAVTSGVTTHVTGDYDNGQTTVNP